MVDFLAKNVIRIVAGVIIVGAVTVLTNSMLPVASHHAASTTANCALSATTLGAAVPITGSGFAPGTQYFLLLSTPATSGGTTVTTSATGSFTYATMVAYSKGTYGASVWTEGHHSTLAANCASVTVS
jgi:hypothetical protein